MVNLASSEKRRVKTKESGLGERSERTRSSLIDHILCSHHLSARTCSDIVERIKILIFVTDLSVIWKNIDESFQDINVKCLTVSFDDDCSDLFICPGSKQKRKKKHLRAPLLVCIYYNSR